MKLHAFVAMPFGKKTGPDGTVIGFNAAYENLQKPGIEAALASGHGRKKSPVYQLLSNLQEPLQKPERQWQPRQVFLFSGHRIDAPDRATPRFPADKAAIAAQKIDETLAQLGAGPEDLALTQGACGGDILFAEACLQRGVKLKLLQPFEEAVFIEKSVLPGGESWRDRYYAIKPQTEIKAAPIELSEPPISVNPYERCNLWLLDTALAYGIEKVRFICLWNGEGDDAPGGTAHMYQEVNEKNGQVVWLDTRKLW